MAGSYQAEKKDEPASRAPSQKGEDKVSTRSGSASDAGTPLFLQHSQIEPEIHHSPPGTGPGSRSEPLVIGRKSVHLVSAMKTDAYYRSPVNDTNPVLVWTNGSALFFGPSQGQVDLGAAKTPEPSYSAPSGYAIAEIHWDRAEGLLTGGGSLVVIARKPGEADLSVTVTDALEQKTTTVVGSTSGTNLTASREGGEFLKSDDTAVSLELSGAGALGEIHGESFSEGFFRYRAVGGDHDLYVAQGTGPAAYLVERATGKITRRFTAGSIAAIVARGNGLVDLETSVVSAGATSRSTVAIDLRTSPPKVSTATGHASAETDYDSTRARLEGLGVTFEERAIRMRVVELTALETALQAGGGRGLSTLREFRTLEGGSGTDAILEVSKTIGPDNAYGLASAGSGVPTLTVLEPFDSPSGREATIRHEMTHVIMGATDAVTRSKLTALQRADLEASLRFEARQAQKKSAAGLLRRTEYGPGDVVPPVGTVSSWKEAVGGDVQLANIWVELMRRYSFIPDPEGTRQFRGVSLADESRYSEASENTGHPAENAAEFAASFVACATVFKTQFVAAVFAAETAGNAKGGGGGSYLRGLYRKAWSVIDLKYVPLGSNPF